MASLGLPKYFVPVLIVSAFIGLLAVSAAIWAVVESSGTAGDVSSTKQDVSVIKHQLSLTRCARPVPIKGTEVVRFEAVPCPTPAQVKQSRAKATAKGVSVRTGNNSTSHSGLGGPSGGLPNSKPQGSSPQGSNGGGGSPKPPTIDQAVNNAVNQVTNQVNNTTNQIQNTVNGLLPKK